MPMKGGQHSRHLQGARISHCSTWIVFFETISIFISYIVNYLFCIDKPTSNPSACQVFLSSAVQSRARPQVTYTSDRRQLQMHRDGAAGNKGCQPAQGRRLLVCPTAKNKSNTTGGPLGNRMHMCSPPSREGQLAADLSRTTKLNFFNPILL